jgi:hypothetical protein
MTTPPPARTTPSPASESAATNRNSNAERHYQISHAVIYLYNK